MKINNQMKRELTKLRKILKNIGFDLQHDYYIKFNKDIYKLQESVKCMKELGLDLSVEQNRKEFNINLFDKLSGGKFINKSINLSL